MKTVMRKDLDRELRHLERRIETAQTATEAESWTVRWADLLTGPSNPDRAGR